VATWSSPLRHSCLKTTKRAAWHDLGDLARPVASLQTVIVIWLLGSWGCSYDYSSLSIGHLPDGGTADRRGSGGMAGTSPPRAGSGGARVLGTGGVDAAGDLGGQPQTGGGAVGTGGAIGGGGQGDAGVASGGAAAGGSGTGGMDIVGTGGGPSGGAGVPTGTGGGVGAAGGAGGIGGADGVGGAGGSRTLVLSIDFIGGRFGTGGAGGTTAAGAVTMGQAEVAGVKPASHWNGAAGPSGAIPGLMLSDGVVTTASATWSSPATMGGAGIWTNGYTDAPGDVRMMNGYLDPTDPSLQASVTITGLPASLTAAGYDVYVYGGGDIRSVNTRTCRYAIGTSSSTASEVGPTATTFKGYTAVRNGGTGNYVVFRSLTAASFTLTATPGASTPSRAPVNGIQIVSPTGS